MEPCKYGDKIIKMHDTIDEIYIAIVGDLKTPGMKTDVENLKSWRISCSSRQKGRAAIWASIIGGIIVVVVGGVILMAFEMAKK